MRVVAHDPHLLVVHAMWHDHLDATLPPARGYRNGKSTALGQNNTMVYGVCSVYIRYMDAPRDHPDISPAHEALQMMELFVEIGRTDDAKSRPEDFRRYLSQAERASRSLEEVLRGPHPDVARAEQEFVALKQSCNACHADFRN